jgi:hypothetical protein
LGASTETFWAGPLDLAFSGAVGYRAGGDVIPSAGAEVAYWPVQGRTFILRLGLRDLPVEQSGSSFTFGGGFRGDELVLDYAYERFASGNPSHRLTIGWR